MYRMLFDVSLHEPCSYIILPIPQNRVVPKRTPQHCRSFHVVKQHAIWFTTIVGRLLAAKSDQNFQVHSCEGDRQHLSSHNYLIEGLGQILREWH